MRFKKDLLATEKKKLVDEEYPNGIHKICALIFTTNCVVYRT